MHALTAWPRRNSVKQGSRGPSILQQSSNICLLRGAASTGHAKGESRPGQTGKLAMCNRTNKQLGERRTQNIGRIPTLTSSQKSIPFHCMGSWRPCDDKVSNQVGWKQRSNWSAHVYRGVRLVGGECQNFPMIREFHDWNCYL